MNRRDFLKSAGGAFTIAAAGKVFGADAPSNRVRLALVGCHAKGRGAAVMRNALKVPGVEISWVCDVDSRALDFAAAEVEKLSGVKPRKEKDLRKVLEDKNLDGIISETPDHFHAWSAVMAMRAGKNVYVEKPCCFCPREGEIILDTWRRTGMVFQMGSQRRSAPAFMQAMSEIKEKGLLGTPTWGKCWYHTKRAPIGNGVKVAPPDWLDWDLWQGPAPREAYRDNLLHYNWHWFRAWGTGECGNNSVHFVDVARWCLGVDYPTRVTSDGGRFWIPATDDWQWPDTQTANYTFPGGKFITWEGTCCVNAKPYMNVTTGAMIFGTNGNSVFFMPGGGVRLFGAKNELLREWGTDGAVKAPVLTNTDDRTGGSWADSTTDHLANYVDCIRAKTPEKARSNADIGVKSTDLALVANIAQATGAAVELDPVTGRLLTKSAADLWSRAYEKGWELEG